MSEDSNEDNASVALSLTDLPEELLSQVLTGAGSRAILNTAAACRRLQSIKVALGQHPCFASAASQLPKLEDALKDAAGRAMEGMLGSVSFAVLFTCNYPTPKKYRDPGDVSKAAEILSNCLPKGTPVVGCTTAGIMGTGADGRPFEIDPSAKNQRGVTLLLGYMPHAEVRVYADIQAPSQRASSKAGPPPEPWAAVEQWVGLQRRGLVPVASWVMLQATRAAAACVSGPNGLLDWIQAQGPPGSPPAVAGGVASGRCTLLFHPGRQEEEAAAHGWDPLLGAQKARYVGLMICSRQPQGPGPSPTAPTACNASSSSYAQPRHLAPGPSTALRLPPAAPCGPRAAVLSMRGAGCEPGSSWWSGLRLEHVRLDDEDCHLINLNAGAGGFKRIGPSPSLQPLPPPSTAGPSSQSPTPDPALAPLPPPRDFASEFEALGEARLESDAQSPLLLAMWRYDATPDCLSTGLSPEVMASGLCLVAGLGRCPYSGAFRVVVDTTDDVALDRVLEQGPERVCCQLASVSAGAIRTLLSRELRAACDMCAPLPLPLTQPVPGPGTREWEGYLPLRRSAQAVGARSGPSGMVVFTCTGRGTPIFGHGGDSEARITDEVLGAQLPFIGVYCNGEVGPTVRNGYVGWAVAGTHTDGLDPGATDILDHAMAAGPGSRGSPGAVAGGGGGVCLSGGERAGRGAAAGSMAQQALQDPCTLQGWTSMYSVLG